MKKYTFQMTEKEVKELSFKIIVESQRPIAFKWLLLAAIVAFECVIAPDVAPYVIALPVLLLLVGFALFIAKNYSIWKKRLCDKTQSIWVEEGMLKLDAEEERYSEISCNRITVVRRTRSLLMLGDRSNARRIAWYPVPIRVFADERELERFVESIRSPQTQEREEAVSWVQEEEGSVSEKYFSFSFSVGEEDWVRLMADAAEVLQAGTLGKQKKGYIVWMAFMAGIVIILYWIAWHAPNAEMVGYIAMIIGIIFLVLLQSRLEKPEKEIRRQVRKGNARNTCGDWEVFVTETGIWQSIQTGSDKNGIMVPWEDLFCVVETDGELFFFKKDKREMNVILKASMDGREQIESLKELCREKKLEVLTGKQRKYVPDWFAPLLKGVGIVVFLVLLVGLTSRNAGRDINSVTVSFGEQVSTLRSFGFTIPEELEDTLWDYVEENDMTAYVEEYPYTWLLMNLAWVGGDEDWEEWYQDGTGVFWFDFEGWDISTDYIRILEGMQELSVDSILEDVQNIQEDTENMDWEKGTGTITVSLDWKGQEYSWEMDVEYDWIDEKVLGIYNGLLKKQGIPERFYMTGDDGQGALVFYCTKDWASEFEDATGLDLKAYMVQKGW